MDSPIPQRLAIIAGKGNYPRLLAQSARAQGVAHITAIAFKKETHADIAALTEQTRWIYVGQLQRMLDEIQASGAKAAVMAGQITPTHLFRVRMDARMLALLKKLPQRNAHTIFSAIADELASIGVELLSACTFMETHMTPPGTLTRCQPDARTRADIQLGLEIANVTSRLEIGQTVVIKDGTVLAVEAFEGTDAALKRARKLGGSGMTVVKLAKPGHDMRFDIPIVGDRTIRILKKCNAAALAIEAGRSILLDREYIVRLADEAGLALVAIPGTEVASIQHKR
ncbi:MAG: UDP-2,3-diacylglucosamine diphosphatase LpxI [Verrucomicrobia bacterium]|nr:UDP-2,3-diacylglucosamine diphosphatase LpxI [Verrucomicrobiota bacterium]